MGKEGLRRKGIENAEKKQPKHWTAWAAENPVHETLAALKWLALLPLSSAEPGFGHIYLL